jgi:hypothetical protein
MKSLRWRMIALLTIGAIINSLTRSTLGVAEWTWIPPQFDAGT